MSALANEPAPRLLRPIEWWRRRAPALRWAAVAGEMAMLWWTSSRQLHGLGTGIMGALAQNGAHVLAYGGMGVLALLALRGTRPLRPRDCAAAVAIAVAYGAIDELHQQFVPGRVSSLSDLGSDAAGATIGVCAVMALAGGSRRWALAALVAALASTGTVAVATFTAW